MMIMVSSNDLISLYLSIELQSLPLYVLASIRNKSSKSTESGLKYFVLGVSLHAYSFMVYLLYMGIRDQYIIMRLHQIYQNMMLVY